MAGGQAVTVSQGDTTEGTSVRLRSRKTPTGTSATWELVGTNFSVSQGTIQASVPPVVVVPPPEDTDFLRLSDGAVDGASWLYSNSRLQPRWTVPGGDWRGVDENLQSLNPYATLTVSTFTAGQTKDVVCTLLVQKWLADGNTGLHIRRVSGPNLSVASRTNLTEPAPFLTVNTTSGSFICPLLASIRVASSAAHSAVQGTTLSDPFMLRFDLSAVTGTVNDAFIRFKILQVFSGTLPAVWHINRLEVPQIIDDPKRQIGVIEQGIAATVTDDLALASHPDILQYNNLTDDATVANQFWALSYGTTTHSYRDVGQFGFKVIRSYMSPATISGMLLHKFVQPKVAPPTALNNAAWRRPYQSGAELGYNKMYWRWVMSIDPAAQEGINSGVKMPGPEGTYEFSDSGVSTSPPPPVLARWSAWTWHSKPSIEHRYLVRPHIYSNDQYNGTGVDIVIPFNLYPLVCWRMGQEYVMEMLTEMNTITNGVPNFDGKLIVWMDGVMVHFDDAFKFRGTPEAQNHNFRALFFHGGQTDLPFAPYYYEFGGFAMSDKSYIGPPKVKQTEVSMTPTFNADGTVSDGWWNSLPLNTPVKILGTKPNTVIDPYLATLVDADGNPYDDHGGEGLYGVWRDWSGAAFDQETGNLHVNGGGHAGSSNNGLFSYDLERAKWRVSVPPTVLSPEMIQKILDGPCGVQWPGRVDWGTDCGLASFWVDNYGVETPTSQHTWENMAWDPIRRRIFALRLGAYFAWLPDQSPGWVKLGPQVENYQFGRLIYDDVADVIWHTANPGGGGSVLTAWKYRSVNPETGIAAAPRTLPPGYNGVGAKTLVHQEGRAILGREFCQLRPAFNIAWAINLDTHACRELNVIWPDASHGTPYGVHNFTPLTATTAMMYGRYLVNAVPTPKLFILDISNPAQGTCTPFIPAGGVIPHSGDNNGDYDRVGLYRRRNVMYWSVRHDQEIRVMRLPTSLTS